MSAEFLDGSARYDTDYRSTNGSTNVGPAPRSLATLQRSDGADAVGARGDLGARGASGTQGGLTGMRRSNAVAPDGGSMGTGADMVRGLPVSDEVAIHDERSAPVRWLGCSVAKLFEICVASSIHTVVWVVLLLWIDLFYASHIFGGQSIADTAFACLFIWISTFMCFYALVEDDD